MSESETDSEASAVVLDFLPNGRAEDDRPQYQKEPVAYVLTESDFHLLELTLEQEASVGIGDSIPIEPPAARENVTNVREVAYGDLTSAAQSELEHAVADIVDRHERRFVDFYNDAQPITLRLHQLNLLPGIGKKLAITSSKRESANRSRASTTSKTAFRGFTTRRTFSWSESSKRYARTI